MTALAKVFVTVEPQTDRFEPDLKRKLRSVDGDRLGNQLGTRIGVGLHGAIGSAVSRSAKLFAVGFAAIKAGGFLKGAITEASDLGETVSKTQQIFGKSSAAVIAFGKNAGTSLGQSQNQALTAAANFGNLFNNLGLTQNASAKMSTQLVKTATDLASFNNASPQEMLEGIQSALAGEFDPLQRYGLAINAAAVKQEALRLGLAKSTKEITPAASAQAAYSLILQQTGKASGDFARTSGGLANQQRILSAQFTNFKASIGAVALPLITKLFSFINNRAIPAAKGLFALFSGGKFTKDLRQAFNLEEDSGIVDFLFRVRDAAIGLFKLFARGEFSKNLRQAFNVEEDSGFVTFLFRVRDAVISVAGFVQSAILPALGRFAKAAGPVLANVLRAVAGFIKEQVVPALKAFGGYVTGTLVPAAIKLWAFLAKNLGPTFSALGHLIVTRIGPALQGLFARFQQVWPTVRTVIVFVAKLVGGLLALVVIILGKVLPVIIKLAGPVFTLLFAAIGKIIGIVAALARAFIAGARLIINVFLTMVNAVISGAAKAFGWVPGLGGKLKSAAAAFSKFRDQVNSALAGVKSRKVTVSATLTAGSAPIRSGGVIARAAGGPIFGPGTATSDSIPALLSNGEHVLTAKEVRGFGGHAAVEQMRQAAVAGFAAGGPVRFDVDPRLLGMARFKSDLAAFNKRTDTAARKLVPQVSSAFGGGGSVARWLPVVLQVLAALGQPSGLSGAVLRRISFESGGNPNAINLTDSNARAGHPSQGLVQTIPATFAAYAGPYAGRGITDPFANIYAGMNYALHRYGSIAAIDPLVRPRGYRDGLSYVPYDNFPAMLHRGERVMTARENSGAQGDALLAELRGLRRDLASLPIAQVDERLLTRKVNFQNGRNSSGW